MKDLYQCEICKGWFYSEVMNHLWEHTPELVCDECVVGVVENK